MAQLILHNDDDNSFLKVKACLIKCCNHLPLQAEQCALIANNNKKCTIKEGDFLELLEIKTELERFKLNVEIIS